MGEWISPEAPAPPHDCYDELPGWRRGLAEHKDEGRKYQCSCGQVWQVVVEPRGEDDFLYAIWYKF